MQRNPDDIRPPRIPLRIIKFFLKDRYVEEIEGDFEERFLDNLKQFSVANSKRKYTWDTLKLLLSPILLRKIGGEYRLNHFGMLQNHLRFTARLFLKNKFYTSLNLLGLVFGIMCSMICMLYLQNELTYDLHHERHSQIYRLTNRIHMTGFDINYAKTAQELPALIESNMPELVSYVRFMPFNEDDQTVAITYRAAGGIRKQFYEERLMRADSNIFNFFSHRLIFGDPSTCLAGPNKMVLTESMAIKYFGDESALGKILTVSSIEEESFEVTAVVEDLPDNSHFKFDFLVSNISSRPWVPYAGFGHTIWNPNAYSYLMFPQDYNPSEFSEKFKAVFDQHFTATAEELGGVYTPTLELLADVHFSSNTQFDEPQGDISFVYIFGCVGALILLMVCINYVNLSMARSLTRSREMGVRKVLGTTRRTLFYVMLSETLVLVTIAYLFAIIISYFLIHASPLNELIGKELRFDLLANPLLLYGSIGLMITVGLICGIYPGLYIPSQPTVAALKGHVKDQKSSGFFRKALITFQLTVSLAVIISTVLMGNQLEYMQNKNLGFNMDNLLLLRIPDGLSREKLQSSLYELQQSPGVLAATYGGTFPGADPHSGVFKIESKGEFLQHEIKQNFVGDRFLETMEMKLLDGRDFYIDSEVDELNSFIVNEAMAREMGWKESPIGKKIERWDGKKLGSVIGLIADYNFSSLHVKVEPMFIRLFREPDEDEPAGYYHLRVRSKDLTKTVDSIEEGWEKLFPESIFEIEFLDQKLNIHYKADKQQNQIFGALSFASIFIALLGLIGLSLYSATQKTKEIGIRKTLGATIMDILMLLSSNFFWLMILSCMVAIPLSYVFIQEWLNAFAYRTTLHWWDFVLPVGVVLLTTLTAVSSQSLKTSLANPVDSLRNE
ncbi:MAG: FtsX-like permease family protein [Cyclobacteriaceae bacterium]